MKKLYLIVLICAIVLPVKADEDHLDPILKSLRAKMVCEQ